MHCHDYILSYCLNGLPLHPSLFCQGCLGQCCSSHPKYSRPTHHNLLSFKFSDCIPQVGKMARLCDAIDWNDSSLLFSWCGFQCLGQMPASIIATIGLWGSQKNIVSGSCIFARLWVCQRPVRWPLLQQTTLSEEQSWFGISQEVGVWMLSNVVFFVVQLLHMPPRPMLSKMHMQKLLTPCLALSKS